MQNLKFTRNVVLKSLLLFLLLNLLFAFASPLPFLGRISAYNLIFPGRQRLPYGDNPELSYNLSLFNLEAMFASHEIDDKLKLPDEFRVVVIGDSAAWGYLLQPDETLAARLTALGLTTPDGRRLVAFNLGYPVMSLTKDLLVLSLAMRYQPDLILWPLTLESFPADKQLFSPLLQHNPQPVRTLIQTYHLNLPANDPGFVEKSFWDKTIIGERRELADIIRLQLYGVMWAATGNDHYISPDYIPRQEDLPADERFHEFMPPNLRPEDLSFDVLHAGVQMTGDIPLLIVNEPTFVSQGENSDIRYNFYYPRWAYDDYRVLLSQECNANAWRCLDLWDAIDAQEFTNTAIHLTPRGTSLLANLLGQAILDLSSRP